MTDQTRAKAGRRARRSASQLFIAALVVFGVVASVLLLFSENVQWLRVGLVSALWAAIVGAFAMTKYRREAAADQTKAKDLQTVYELQLAREISARREYEMGVEARVRSEVQLETSEVAALRAELALLRNNLQMLFDGNLPTERVALRAEATRLQELGGGRNYDGYQPAPSGLYVPGGSPQAPSDTSDPDRSGGQGPGEAPFGQAQSAQVASGQPVPGQPVPGLANPYDEPVTAETSVLYPEVPIGDERPAGYTARGQTPRRPQPRAAGNERRIPTPPRATGRDDRPSRENDKPSRENEPAAAASSGNGAEEVVDERVEPYSFGRPTPVTEPTPEPEPQPEPAPADTSPPWDLPEPRPRRRRRAEPESDGPSGAHANGRSVADILAGMQTGGTEPTERRHRRRAE